MAQPLQTETFPPLSAMHDEVAELLPTQKFHGQVRVPGLHEDIGWTLEVPEEGLAYEGLVLLLPGLGCVKRHSRGERHANAVAGEPTISYSPARVSGNTVENLLFSQKLPCQTAEVVLRDVQRLFKGRPVVPGARQIDPHRVMLSPHSMGGHAATMLGLKHPAEVDAVIYKASIGFGTPSWRAFEQLDIPSTMVEILDYITSDRANLTPKQMWESVRYFLRSPSRSVGELAACLTLDMTEDVVALGQKNVPTAYLGFEKDGLVPVKPVRPVARRTVDIFEMVPGMGHLAPQRYPVETAAAVRGLRRRLRP